MLTNKDLAYLERLSKIELSNDLKDRFITTISDILKYVEKLFNIDTKNVPITTHVANLENVLRDDIIKPSLSQEEVLMNSKHTYKGYFKIPKVIE